MIRSPQRGFTLIEMLVSVAIFSIVMVIVAAAYLNLINLDRQARATDDVVNNLSFAIDNIERSIRTGTNYHCDNAMPGPNGTPCVSTFNFIDSAGNHDSYILNPNTHQLGECVHLFASWQCNTSIATYFTDPRINIKNVSFYVVGALQNDQEQPFVVFTITGTIVIDAVHAPVTFTIQSATTPRGIDI